MVALDRRKRMEIVARNRRARQFARGSAGYPGGSRVAWFVNEVSLAKSEIDGKPGVRRGDFLRGWRGRGGYGNWGRDGLRWSRQGRSGGAQALLEQGVDTVDALAAFDAHAEAGAQIAETAGALVDRLSNLVVGN